MKKVFMISVTLLVFTAAAVFYAFAANEYGIALTFDSSEALIYEGVTPEDTESEFDYEIVIPYNNDPIDVYISEEELTEERTFTSVSLYADGKAADWGQGETLSYDEEGALAFTVPENLAFTYGPYTEVTLTLREDEAPAVNVTVKIHTSEETEETDISDKYVLASGELITGRNTDEENAYEISFTDASGYSA